MTRNHTGNPDSAADLIHRIQSNHNPHAIPLRDLFSRTYRRRAVRDYADLYRKKRRAGDPIPPLHIPAVLPGVAV